MKYIKASAEEKVTVKILEEFKNEFAKNEIFKIF